MMEHDNLAVVVAGAYEDSTESVNPRVIKAMHAILDFSYKAQFPVHSNESLAAMAGDLEKYYSAVRGFLLITIHTHCSAKGMLIPHFCRDIQDHGSDSGPPSLNYDEENSDHEAPDPDSGTWAALIQAQDQLMHSSCTTILSKWPNSTLTIEHMAQKVSSPDLISTVV